MPVGFDLPTHNVPCRLRLEACGRRVKAGPARRSEEVVGRAGGRAGEGQARCGAHIMSAVFELAVARGRSVSGGRGLAEARDEWMEPGKLADIFVARRRGEHGALLAQRRQPDARPGREPRQQRPRRPPSRLRRAERPGPPAAA